MMAFNSSRIPQTWLSVVAFQIAAHPRMPAYLIREYADLVMENYANQARLCFCGNANASSSVISTAPSSCNQPCPGNPAEICGGRISKVSRILKRQTSLAGILLTLYANPAIIDGSANSSPSSTMSPISLPIASSVSQMSTPLPSQVSSASIQTIVLTSTFPSLPIVFTPI